MKVSRRGFLKIGSAWVLGLTALPGVEALAGNGQGVYSRSPGAMEGKRWAMIVDINKCDGCMKCQSACHKAHNVPDIDNEKESVKWVWEESYDHVFPGMENKYINEAVKQKPCMVLCNHCDKPACVRVCPTKATFKRKDGIVLMDYHRCIGCRYCMAACPYGARSFNFKNPRPYIKEINSEYPTRKQGVVEKCNLCEERLSSGKLPLCVEACPNGVYTFGDLEDSGSEARKLLSSKFTIQRRVELGVRPNIYYIV